MIWDLTAHADKTAIITPEKEFSYQALHEACSSIAEQLRSRTLVFHLTSNTPGSVIGYIAFLNEGIVPLVLDEEIDAEMLDTLIQTYEPSYLWIPAKLRERFQEDKEIFSAWNYCLLDRGIEEPTELYEELALLINTSGSTGSPKLVRQSYRNIISNMNSIADYLHLTSSERAITSLPMNYVYGLSVIHSHLAVGGSLILTDENCYSKRFWGLANEMRATSFAGVPFMYEMLYKLRITKKDLPTVRTWTQAGGHLSKELQEYYSNYAKENDKEFIVMYGASEATSRMSYLPFADAFTKNGSIGIAIPGGRFELLDEDGKAISDANKVGELLYYGENVALGYAEKKEDLVKGDDNKGVLLTGDMAYRDEDGYYYIAGRKKRFLKILGKRTNLDEIEELLKSTFVSVDLACGGKDDLLCIFVTDSSNNEEISRFLAKRTGINEKLLRVVNIPEIPKNNAGKVLYSELNQIAGKE